MKKRRGARLGQHFLKHAWAASALAHAVPLAGEETILEIGPGKGVLTRELLKRGDVVAVEKDAVLVETLRETFAEEIQVGRLRIVEKDIRDFDPGTIKTSYVVAAIIPYYITGEIIRQFLTAEHQPHAMALLVQKEVADRIVARDGKESILSLSVKVYGEPRIVARVGRSHFSPPPSVDSAILVIENISKKLFKDISEEQFFAVVRAGFASKRKLAANNLSTLWDKEFGHDVLSQCGIEAQARPEDINLEQWKCLVSTGRSFHGH